MNGNHFSGLAALFRQLEIHQGEIVLRDIDNGCSSQFWLAPMSASGIEEWWRSQESFESSPDGVLDSYLRRPNGAYIYHSGYQGPRDPNGPLHPTTLRATTELNR